MKWYKKQLDALQKNQTNSSEPDKKSYLEANKHSAQRKIAKPGEKKSRPKTDSK